jgi:hypothetical protein
MEPFPGNSGGDLRASRATLGSGDKRITIDCDGLRASAEVAMLGEWPERDLTVLACFFAVIARRRRSIVLFST